MKTTSVTAAVALLLAITACESTAEPTTTQPVSDPGFYLNLMWHQHQPFYPKDANGVYTRPWVRVHATKDYYDMAALVSEYPNVHVTFNLTPVLLLQLEDLSNGAKDTYQVVAEVPADELSPEQKTFLVDRFFDTNSKIIDRFPRYRELAEMRSAADGWTDQDFRDLQVLFNLAWTDPSFLGQQPLAALVEKGHGYSEEDKALLFAEHLRIIQEVIPLHARLWNEGSIEVTTTPLAHPILPLIADTNLASVGDPTAILPEIRFQEIVDADQHVIRGLDTAERLLGRRPTGMWPGEGSIAQLVMSLFSKNGVKWVASGEETLAASLGIGSFTRNASDVVVEADQLYRPYQAVLRRNDPVPVFFRDGLLSDLVGFEYSGMSGAAAADDFMRRLRSIKDELQAGDSAQNQQPYVVSVILDGENAWEHYDNDGIEFLEALYQNLNDADWVGTITPSEYLERFGEPESLEEVWPGAWFQANFATWIGETEEAEAWDYLARVRADYEDAERQDVFTEMQLAAAFEKMLFAEGSDWFWWYGSDQDSGNDSYFDSAFRELLGQVYDALGIPRPSFLSVPIIPENPIIPDASPSDLIEIDFMGDDSQWDSAGLFTDPNSGDEFQWAFDRTNLYLLVDTGSESFDIYLGGSSGEKSPVSLEDAPLGFAATSVIRVIENTPCLQVPVSNSECLPLAGMPSDRGLQIQVPLQSLGALESGDTVLSKFSVNGTLRPASGPIPLQVPDISEIEVAIDVVDPVGDDHGPGGYTYPTDTVFTPGSFDLTRFQVGTEGENVVVVFEVVAPIANPWGSPRSLSIQTFDAYFDVDPGGDTGNRLLLPGRNAALVEGSGWDFAITLEGWEPAILRARADGTFEEIPATFSIVVFPEKGKVVAKIPTALLGGSDPATWSAAGIVMSQEGYPSSGVRRIRDVEPVAQQWRIGGGDGSSNQTRILDVAFPESGEQEELLSDREALSGPVDTFGPDDFGQIPVN